MGSIDRQVSLHVLVVEDEVDSAAALAELLCAWGHRSVVASSIADAWHAVETASITGDPFDVAIVDISLPDGDGWELMRTLARHYPLKGIALSGRDSEGDIARSLENGFEWHLAKPVRTELLAHSLVSRNLAA